MESYVGQIKPVLFLQSDTQVIDSIPPKDTVKLIFEVYPSFTGLISTAVRVTDSLNNNIVLKRNPKELPKESPIRWWWSVADDISIETLRALKKLIKQGSEGAKK